MILTNSGVLKLMQRIKSFITSQLNTKAPSVHTHTISEIDDLSSLQMGGGYSKSEVDTLLNGKADTSHTHSKSQITDFPSYGTTANTICEGNDSRLSDARTPTSHTHTKSEITDFPTLSTVATSGSYSDLSNKPTIPTVNNATLTIQKNGTTVKTFTANASSNVTANITVPTKVSELTNDSGFLTSHQSLSNYSTLANTVKSLSISGKTITVTPGSGDAYTLTTQDTTYTHPTSSGNKHIPSGGSSGQFLGYDSDGTAKWVNNPNSDTKNTAGSTDTSSKIFLIGATSQAANLQTYSHDTAYVGTDGCLYSGGTKVLTSHQSLSNYSTLSNTIKSLSISGKTITYTKGDNTTGTLTTQDNNTWTAMVGATSSSNGSVGYVNAVPPKDGYNTKYLRADGTWQVPPDHTYTVNNATLTIQKNGSNVATFTSNASSNVTCNITVPTKTSELTNNSGFLTSHQSLSGYVPKSGGAVITGSKLGRTVNNGEFILCGGTDWSDGSFISLHGQNFNDGANETGIGAGSQRMRLYPSGTWTWSGTAVQLTSDQRLKQQISQIDDKLLDAWQDVELVQFKYNDAVNEKGDNARLHTGYVVQQINEACQKHDVDISEYGLYCHEEYPERTDEVEVTQDDGSIKKETKVIEEASEHYSLRYTETLVVECAYLRRENARLKERLQRHDDYFSNIEKRLQSLENS